MIIMQSKKGSKRQKVLELLKIKKMFLKKEMLIKIKALFKEKVYLIII